MRNFCNKFLKNLVYVIEDNGKIIINFYLRMEEFQLQEVVVESVSGKE